MSGNLVTEQKIDVSIDFDGGNMEPSHGNVGGWAPPPPPPETVRKKPWVLMAMIVVVLVALVFALLALMNPFGKDQTRPAAAQPTAMKTTTPVYPSQGGNASAVEPPLKTPSSEEPSSPTSLEQEGDAATELANLRERNSSGTRSQLMGKWAVQLASSPMRSEDEAYLAKHLRLHAQYGAFLSTTDDFANKRETGVTFWVTFLADGFIDKADADSWCQSHDLDSNSCLAREMTSTRS